MKTAAIFSLNLMPQAFFLHRIKDADTVIILTDLPLDQANHVNRFVIRTATQIFRSISVPVKETGIPVDEVIVQDPSLWTAQFQRDVRRSYRGLIHAEAAQVFVNNMLDRSIESPWLTDYLVNAFMLTLEMFGWSKKTVIRGCSPRRRRYGQDSEYLLDLCIDADCDRLLVGRTQQRSVNQRMFRRNDIELVTHKWEGTKDLSSRDSILDVVARLSVPDILTRFE